MELFELFNNILLNGFSHKIVTSSKNIFPGFQPAPPYLTLTMTNEYRHCLIHYLPLCSGSAIIH